MSTTNINPAARTLIACMALCLACLLASCGSSDASNDQTAGDAQRAAETEEVTVEDTASGQPEAADSQSDGSDEPAQESGSANAKASLTLEEYFSQNPRVYEQMLESFQQGFASGSDESVPMTATLETYDNNMVCRVVIDLSFDADMIAAAQDAMGSEMDGYEETMTALLSQVEESTGCSPVTITVGYYDKDENTILERTYE